MFIIDILTLLHSEGPKLYGVLVFLSAIGIILVLFIRYREYFDSLYRYFKNRSILVKIWSSFFSIKHFVVLTTSFLLIYFHSSDGGV